MRKWLLRILLLLAVLGLAVGGWQLWQSMRANQQEAEVGAELKPSVPETSQPDDRPKMPFGGLQSKNPEIIAWIKVDGTQIDYPVVQTDNNEYYLTRDVYRRRTIFGALFLDYRDRPDFSDFSSVIYGHHIKNSERMFQNLTKFKTKVFFDSHKIGTLYTPEQTYQLEIFAVALTTPTSDFYRYAFISPAEQQAHLDMIRSKAVFYRDIGVGIDDHIVILSTCSYEYNEARTVVAARLR